MLFSLLINHVNRNYRLRITQEKKKQSAVKLAVHVTMIRQIRCCIAPILNIVFLGSPPSVSKGSSISSVGYQLNVSGVRNGQSCMAGPIR